MARQVAKLEQAVIRAMQDVHQAVVRELRSSSRLRRGKVKELKKLLGAPLSFPVAERLVVPQ